MRILSHEGFFERLFRSNWRLQPSFLSSLEFLVFFFEMPRVRRHRLGFQDAVFPRDVIRILRWNISYLFRDGSKGELPTFHRPHPYRSWFRVFQPFPAYVQPLCQYIGSQGSRGIFLPEAKVTPLIVFLWSQSTPRRDPVKRSVIRFVSIRSTG